MRVRFEALARWLLLVGGALLVSQACGLPAPVPAPAPASPVASAPPPPSPASASAVGQPTASATVVAYSPQSCGQDRESELPVARARVGQGDRVVRIINNSEDDVQARLLDEHRGPVYAGTLRVAAGERGEYRVPAGVYVLRYRRGGSCQVMRGTPLRLVGHNIGVEIAIHPRFARGGHANMRPVKEPL